jgi:hypothetical protein
MENMRNSPIKLRLSDTCAILNSAKSCLIWILLKLARVKQWFWSTRQILNLSGKILEMLAWMEKHGHSKCKNLWKTGSKAASRCLQNFSSSGLLTSMSILMVPPAENKRHMRFNRQMQISLILTSRWLVGHLSALFTLDRMHNLFTLNLVMQMLLTAPMCTSLKNLKRARQQ